MNRQPIKIIISMTLQVVIPKGNKLTVHNNFAIEGNCIHYIKSI